MNLFGGPTLPPVDIKNMFPGLDEDELPDLPEDQPHDAQPDAQPNAAQSPQAPAPVPLEEDENDVVDSDVDAADSDSDKENRPIPLGYDPETGEVFHNQMSDRTIWKYYSNI